MGKLGGCYLIRFRSIPGFLCVPHPLCLKLRREQPRSLLFFWRFFVIFRIDGCKQKQTMSSCGDLLDVSVFRDNKIERMRTMKNYEGMTPEMIIDAINRKFPEHREHGAEGLGH